MWMLLLSTMCCWPPTQLPAGYDCNAMRYQTVEARLQMQRDKHKPPAVTQDLRQCPTDFVHSWSTWQLELHITTLVARAVLLRKPDRLRDTESQVALSRERPLAVFVPYV